MHVCLSLQSELNELTCEQETASDSKPDAVEKPAPNSNTLLELVNERVSMYETALQNAKQAGDGSKARRVDRGLKVQLLMIRINV